MRLGTDIYTCTLFFKWQCRYLRGITGKLGAQSYFSIITQNTRTYNITAVCTKIDS